MGHSTNTKENISTKQSGKEGRSENGAKFRKLWRTRKTTKYCKSSLFIRHHTMPSITIIITTTTRVHTVTLLLLTPPSPSFPICQKMFTACKWNFPEILNERATLIRRLVPKICSKCRVATFNCNLSWLALRKVEFWPKKKIDCLWFCDRSHFRARFRFNNRNRKLL